MEPIRGTMVGRWTDETDGGSRRTFDGERKLIAAIIIRAVQESEGGNGEAADWLATTGREWCEKLLGIEQPGSMLSLAEARRQVLADPVASAQRRERDLARYREHGVCCRERLRAANLSEECYA